MIKMVECPNCHGRGTVGFGAKSEKGVAFFDFECPFCKGRCWVSKKRADNYERNDKNGFLCVQKVD